MYTARRGAVAPHFALRYARATRGKQEVNCLILVCFVMMNRFQIDYVGEMHVEAAHREWHLKHPRGFLEKKAITTKLMEERARWPIHKE